MIDMGFIFLGGSLVNDWVLSCGKCKMKSTTFEVDHQKFWKSKYIVTNRTGGGSQGGNQFGANEMQSNSRERLEVVNWPTCGTGQAAGAKTICVTVRESFLESQNNCLTEHNLVSNFICQI